MSHESSPLYFLKEEIFRKWLSNLYVALINSSENCEIMTKFDAEYVDFAKIGGNDLARECMKNACLWLQHIRPFIKNDHTYESQFLRPAQIAAEYILKIRKQTPTTTVKGWIFSISEPYDDMRFGIERVTVSMVVPSLKTIMSLRIRSDEIKNVGLGFYEFGEIQPVPLVNRFHQFHPKISKTNEKISLRDYDFLKVSFDDFDKFSDSIEMSNFCEIDSVQSGLRHHLGSAFVVPCKIIRTRQPRITIQSTVSNSTKTVLMSDQLLKNYNYEFLDSLRNKTGRLLAIQWYDPGGDKGISKKTEVMFMELDEDVASLKKDELLGYVRMRDKVSIEQLDLLFGKIDILSLRSLETEQNSIKFKIFEKSGDFVIDEFLKSVKIIRDLRAPSRIDDCIQLNYFDVVDLEKMSILGLANLVKNDGMMLIILEYILRNVDRKGELPSVSTISSDTGITEAMIHSKSGWLTNLGLVERVDDRIRITTKGKKITFASIKNKIKEKIQGYGQDIISIPEFDTDIPQSMLCEFLEKPESGYFTVELEGIKNKLFWAKSPSNELKKTFQDKFDFMTSEFLIVMRNVNHPFTALKAMEDLSKINNKTTFFSTEIIIHELARKKILIPSGDSWEFVLKSRIMCLLEENPDHVYSTDEIISSLTIPLMNREETLNVLIQLSTNGDISKISLGGWSMKGNEIEKSEKRLLETLHKKIFVLIKSKQHGLDEKILASMIDRMTYDLCKNDRMVNRKKIVKESLKILETNSRISLKDGIYKIKND